MWGWYSLPTWVSVIDVRVYRSPLRLFALGLVGVALILASVDVMFGHWLSTPPEDNDGVLTTRGQAQQRGDIVWGAALVGMGTLLVGGAVTELVRRRPIAEVTQEGVTLAIGAHESDVTIPWSNVRSVSTAVAGDPYDGSDREILIVDVIERDGLPHDPIGAEWRGRELRADAHGWSKAVTEVALSAQGALGHYRRLEEIRQMGPPELTWESSEDDRDDAVSVPEPPSEGHRGDGS